MAPVSSKLAALTFIRERKQVLFGRFSDTLTKQDKEVAWEDVAAAATSIGVLPKDKKWPYLRDTVWQNWRKRTIEKRDNKKKTGTKGGKDLKFDDVDKLILEIIGYDSPILNGLNIPESSGTNIGIANVELTEFSFASLWGSEDVIHYLRGTWTHPNPYLLD